MSDRPTTETPAERLPCGHAASSLVLVGGRCWCAECFAAARSAAETPSQQDALVGWECDREDCAGRLTFAAAADTTTNERDGCPMCEVYRREVDGVQAQYEDAEARARSYREALQQIAESVTWPGEVARAALEQTDEPTA